MNLCFVSFFVFHSGVKVKWTSSINNNNNNNNNNKYYYYYYYCY